MKMRAFIVAISLMMTAFNAGAQEGGEAEDQCKYDYTNFNNHINLVYVRKTPMPGSKKLIRDNFWKLAKDCPTYNPKIYKNFSIFLNKEYLSNKELSKEDKAPWADTLVQVYELQLEYVKPGDLKTQTSIIKTIFRYDLEARYDQAYKMLDEMIAQHEENTDAYILYNDLKKEYDDLKTLTPEQQIDQVSKIIEMYFVYEGYATTGREAMVAKLDAAKAKAEEAKASGDAKTIKKAERSVKASEKALENLDKYAKEMEKVFLRVANDCNVLDQLVLSQLPSIDSLETEARKSELSKWARVLRKRKCNTEAMGAVLESLKTLGEDASLYYQLGLFYLQTDKASDAADNLAKAVEMEKDSALNAEYTYWQAEALSAARKWRSAYDVAKKLTTNDKYKYKAFRIMGTAVAQLAGSVGNTAFENKANYWVAYDLLSRAKGEDVNLGAMKSAFPSSSEIIDAGVSVGSTYFNSYWGVNTTVRSK